MKKSNKKIIIISIILMTLMSIIIPIFMDKFIFSNDYPSSLSNSDWSSFLGGIWGGSIGGIGTLIAIFITTSDTKEVQQANNNQSRSIIAKELLITIINTFSKFIQKNKQIDCLIKKHNDLNSTLLIDKSKHTRIKGELIKENIPEKEKLNLNKELAVYEVQIEKKQEEIKQLKKEMANIINELDFEINLMQLLLHGITFSENIFKTIDEFQNIYLKVNESIDLLNNTEINVIITKFNNETNIFIQEFRKEFIKL